MTLSTVTYIDETVVYKYQSMLRPIPCTLPDGQDCSKMVSLRVRFESLDVEDAEEVVTFDWLYVLGAVGGALTVAELSVMVLHPILQRVVFGKAKEGEVEVNIDGTDDEYEPKASNRDPLLQ